MTAGVDHVAVATRSSNAALNDERTVLEQRAGELRVTIELDTRELGAISARLSAVNNLLAAGGALP